MSQTPATQADMQFANTGLEDFGVSDAVLPRIKIDHQDAVWVDSLGGVKMPTLRFIALGLVKGRVLFHHIVSPNNDDKPMCKSSDFDHGYPNMEPNNNKDFPWQAAGFSPTDFPADDNGQVKLPCNSCALKDWGSHPSSDAPYCSEQWNLPIYYDTSGQPEGTDWQPAILTLQRSAIKPIRTYFTSFSTSGRPPFTQIGHAVLRGNQRGSVKYAVPSFSKQGESDRSMWPEFSSQYAEMRTFLQRPPSIEAEEGAPSATPTDNSYGQQPQQTPPPQQPQAPAQQQDPWTGQTPVQEQPQQPPVQQQPNQADQPPAQQQPQQPPMQPQVAEPVQPTPPTPPAPPQQPEQPPVQQQPQAPAPTPPPPAGGGLPF